jgi:hypothetical protein
MRVSLSPIRRPRVPTPTSVLMWRLPPNGRERESPSLHILILRLFLLYIALMLLQVQSTCFLGLLVKLLHSLMLPNFDSIKNQEKKNKNRKNIK